MSYPPITILNLSSNIQVINSTVTHSFNLYTPFYNHSVFKVSSSMLTELLISALFYAYNTLGKIEYLLVLLSKGSPH